MKRLLLALVLAIVSQAQQDLDRFRDLQQQQELARGQQEEVQKEEAAARRQQFQLGTQTVAEMTRLLTPQRTEGCLAQIMRQDASLDLQTIPLADWLAAGDTSQIPWKVEFGKPELRIDQRYQIAYSGGIQNKDLDWATDEEELVYASGVSTPDGQWIIPPRAARQVFTKLSTPESRIFFGDCIFVKPGDYVLWMVLYHSHSGRHSVSKHRIRPSEFLDEPLPSVNESLPEALFPVSHGPDPRAPETMPGPLFLPVSNKRPLDVELISIVSPADQWAGRSDLIHWVNNRVLAATSVLSQLKMANGSMSVLALDLINRVTPFQQQNLSQLDWAGFARTLTRVADTDKVSVPALETVKERSAFFRKTLNERLGAPAPLRILVVISGTMVFERGSDLAAVSVEGDCHCRVYQVRLRLNRGDNFDDLEKLLKPLRPKSFDVVSGRDMRKALAEIVHDLESF